MIDPHLITEDPDRVKDTLRRRHADASVMHLVERIAALADRRKELINESGALRAERNTLSKQIGGLYKEGRREEAEDLKARVQAGTERTKVLEEELTHVEAQLSEASQGLPNLLHPEAPEGAKEADNTVLHSWGTPRTDTPEAHVEIAERLGILDLERSAKLTGARFSVLRGLGARLERSLINWFLDLHTGDHGYEEVMVPYIVHREMLEGTGQLPKFEHDLFKLTGQLNGSEAFLIPTAEVPVTNLHRDEIVDEADLPIKYACFTPCFRSEAGSAGRDVRGLIRQHQFHKVELVWVAHPDRAEEHHRELLGHAEKALQLLELPYRVVDLCGGDVSFAAHRCFDLEVWLPSQQQYREISSVSHFTDFQTRRMHLRYRPTPSGGKKAKARLAHTLNGSGLAVGRTLVAILENHVQPDGSVVIPEVLRGYMGTDRIQVG
jgi:seryl-tRNA synthetase